MHYQSPFAQEGPLGKDHDTLVCVLSLLQLLNKFLGAAKLLRFLQSESCPNVVPLPLFSFSEKIALAERKTSQPLIFSVDHPLSILEAVSE